MIIHPSRIGTLKKINHYREIEDEGESVLSGFEPATLRPIQVATDDLWLHLRTTLLASLFRLLQRPGVVALW